MPKRPLDKKNADQRRTAAEQRRSAGGMQDSLASIRKSNDRRLADFKRQATWPRPQNWRVEDALYNDAGKRLRVLLGREPTANEIRQLRLGEQALGFEHPAYAKARQLVAEARNLRQTKDDLLSELRMKRKRNKRLRHVAARKVSKT